MLGQSKKGVTLDLDLDDGSPDEGRPSPSWLAELPNRLTFLRIALIPLFVLLAPWDVLALNYLAAIVFAVAALTDFLDGWLARRLDVTSELGALLDPLSDKALFVAAAVVLCVRYPAYFPLFLILILRDLLIMGLRAVAVERGIRIPVNEWGKFKTVVLDVAVVLLVVGDQAQSMPWMPVGFALLLVGLVLSVYSAWLYWQRFYSRFKHWNT